MSRSGKPERDAAFTDFMVAAEPSLMRTAWLFTGSSDAARELVQASLVKTYASWSKVRPETALAFTRRVLVNHKVDVWRVRSPACPSSSARSSCCATTPTSARPRPPRRSGSRSAR